LPITWRPLKVSKLHLGAVAGLLENSGDQELRADDSPILKVDLRRGGTAFLRIEQKAAPIHYFEVAGEVEAGGHELHGLARGVRLPGQAGHVFEQRSRQRNLPQKRIADIDVLIALLGRGRGRRHQNPRQQTGSANG
jgi:hypothetical protein